MIWPWVRRERLEAAENLRLEAEARLGASEAGRGQLTVELAAARQELRDQRAAAEAERERLLDRIAQLTGQPPLYKDPTPAPVANASTAQPGPQLMARARLTQDEIHAKFRAAAASGQVQADKVRVF